MAHSGCNILHSRLTIKAMEGFQAAGCRDNSMYGTQINQQ